jgi:hypothetical protein
VAGSTITGIIDWEMGGFYPEYWEYARMHAPSFMEPNWSYVLNRVFPGPRREVEISAVAALISKLLSTVI